MIGILVECDWFLMKSQSDFIKYKLQNNETKRRINFCLDEVIIALI